MLTAYDYLSRIVSGDLPLDQRQIATKAFAEDLQWNPSYEVKGRYGSDVAEIHLAVEHGLEHSAMLSFIESPRRATDLSQRELRALLSISYNNLIEWHVFVSSEDVRYVNNLDPEGLNLTLSLDRSTYEDVASARRFHEIRTKATRRRLSKACDDAFIDVISKWKRLLIADYFDRITVEDVSALFNCLIFVRGIEDHARSQDGTLSQPLFDRAISANEKTISLLALIEDHLSDLGIDPRTIEYVDRNRIANFGSIDRSTAVDLLKDFYRPGGSAYSFDFALMSKHALSRMYEKYVSILEFELSPVIQTSLFPPVPVERKPKKTGAIYTPQFIAGFFARYVRDNVTPRSFKALKSLDPACGSGIFVRTLLEYQADPLTSGVTTETIREAFRNAQGVDKDPNACVSTRLSLALLHLVSTGALPEKLNVINGDAIDLFGSDQMPSGSYDAVFANPPYIKNDDLSVAERDRYRTFIGDRASTARVDAYLAFVSLCMDAVKPGGIVCLVLPHVFSQANNSEKLRAYFTEQFDLRCLVDLSAVRVFEGVGAYSLLIVAQRKIPGLTDHSPVRVALVRDFTGTALQACLDGKTASTPYYDVFELDQAYLSGRPWILLPPSEHSLQDRLEDLPELDQFLTVKQGVVTGDDTVFIRDRKAVPKGEVAVYRNFLPDRMIERFHLPGRTDRVMFYPFVNGEMLSEDALATGYPQTWAHLRANKERLLSRASANPNASDWWRPARMREPDEILGPKIVCPHLMLTPRFALDTQGEYVVSRSPFLISGVSKGGDDILHFFTAVMNSTVFQWQISRNAHKYASGYNRVEVNLLRRLKVPNPSTIPTSMLNDIISISREIMQAVSGSVASDLLLKLDEIVAASYGLSAEDYETLRGRG